MDRIDSLAIEKELDSDDIVDVDIDSSEAVGQGESFCGMTLLLPVQVVILSFQVIIL